MIGRVWIHEPRGSMHFWHHHDEPEFVVVMRGTARFLLDDRRYDLRVGSLAFLFPAQEHLLADLSPDFRCWIAVIRPRTLRRAASGAAFADLRAQNPSGRFVRTLARGDLAYLDGLCRELAHPVSAVTSNAALPYLFLAAWERYARAAEAAVVALSPPVERAATLLAQEPASDLAVIAARAGLSSSRLSRLFHAQVGQTLVAYRAGARIERFHALRRAHPQRSLLALALDAGFGSYAQFHRAFRRAVGISPRDHVAP